MLLTKRTVHRLSNYRLLGIQSILLVQTIEQGSCPTNFSLLKVGFFDLFGYNIIKCCFIMSNTIIAYLLYLRSTKFICPRISLCFEPIRVRRKHTLCLCIKLLFGSKWQERIEESISLVNPVVLLVGRDECPV